MKKITQLTIYLTIFFAPLYLLKINLWSGASFNFLDVLLFLSIFCGALFIKKSFSWKEVFSFLKKNPLFFGFLTLFVLSFVLSYLINLSTENWTDGLGILKSCLVLPIAFGIVVSFLKTKKIVSVEKLLFTLFLSTDLIGVLGYFYYFNNLLTFDGRLQIFYDSPNALAMILSLGAIIGVFFLFQENSKISLLNQKYTKFFILILLFSDLLSLYKTHSLGAWGAFGVSTLLLLVSFKFRQKLNNRTHFIATSLFFLFFVTFFAFFAILNLNFFLETTDYQPKIPANSIDSRVAIYSSGKKTLQDNWILGIGPGNFQENYLEYQKYFPPYPQWAVPHTHNNFLHIWIEGGIFALLTFLGILFLIFKSFWQQKKPNQNELDFLLLFLIFYFLLHGTIDTTIWKNDLAMIFWTAVLLNYKRS